MKWDICRIVSDLNDLCGYSSIRLTSHTPRMSEALSSYDCPASEINSFYKFCEDIDSLSHSPHTIYGCMHSFRQDLNSEYKITKSKKKELVSKKKKHFLWLSILIGESEFAFMDTWKDELSKSHSDNFDISYYDLRHELMVLDDFAAYSLQKEDLAAFDLASKVIEHGEFCEFNSPIKEGYYKGACHNLSMANSYFVLAMKSLNSEEIEFQNSFIDSFIARMNMALEKTKEWDNISRGFRQRAESMCRTLRDEVTSRKVQGYTQYRAILGEICKNM